jgi:Holliday junction resolvase
VIGVKKIMQELYIRVGLCYVISAMWTSTGRIIMTTASKRKGSKAELDVVKYLQTHGWIYAERRLAGDRYDKGDVAGVNGVCIEIKNRTKISLAEWVEEMIVETKNALARTGVVIHKRKGKSEVKDWYATLPVGMYVQLLKEAGYGEEREWLRQTTH